MDLEREYLWACSTVRDLHEHLPCLTMLASGCQHVTEFGISLGMSGRAFLMGLQRPGCQLVSYDLAIDPEAKRLVSVPSICTYTQIESNVLDIEIAETDLLFLDTRHTYLQLTSELRLHHSKVRKFIVLHDTTSFGHKNEVDDGSQKEGLIPAIQEFLALRPEWTVWRAYWNCNGLMILKRIAQ